MTIKPILNFDEIVSVSSIDNLLKLYQSKGHTFKNDGEFGKRIQFEWKSEIKRIKREARLGVLEGLPTQPQNINLIADGNNYILYGVIHHYASGLYYRAVILHTVKNSDNWLIEQGLTEFFPGIDNGTEVLDWSVDDSTGFKSGVISGLCYPKEIFIDARNRYLLSRKGYKKSDIDEEVTSNRSQDKDIVSEILLSYISHNPESLPKEKPTRVEIEHMLTFLYPLETWHRKLPAYVNIGLRNRSGKKLTRAQERSAYQAEFLRQWPSNSNKQILTGALHSWEIKYFLQQGVKDNRIKDLVSKHIELLQRDPEAYDFLRLQRTTSYRNNFSKGQNLGKLIYTLSGGILIGYLIGRVL